MARTNTPRAQRTLPPAARSASQPSGELTPHARAFADTLFAFVLEQHPFALSVVRSAWSRVVRAGGARALVTPDEIRACSDALRAALDDEVNAAFAAAGAAAGAEAFGPDTETTPFVRPADRAAVEGARLVNTVDQFCARAAIAASITSHEKRWMLAGIILTRAVDNRMKQLFLSSEMKYGDLGFQGKGFRSLGQEAIYGAALRLIRGPAAFDGSAWHGDVIAPLIRDLGVTLAFTDDVEMALNAQVGKAGRPSNGRDLHLGAADRGVLMVAAPLSIGTCTAVGAGLAFKLRDEQRVAVSFIGEGGSSLGEWHEAINLAAVQRLPVIFCVENNQTALSTPVHAQSRVRVFAEKALGYGIPHVTVDGTDAIAVAAAFAWAADRARAGLGPALIETIAMRMAGHAHHDDMLYLGGDPPLGFELPKTPDKGYVDREKYAAWAARDPLTRLAERLRGEGVVTAADVEDMKAAALARVEAAVVALRARPWPDARTVHDGVVAPAFALSPPHDVTAALPALPARVTAAAPASAVVEEAPPFDPKGATLLDAIGRGVADALEQFPDAFLLGEDIGAPYGNAFLLLKPLLEKYGARILNAPIAEGGIIGACVGAAVMGLRPIGEMQFNDFVASGFNQLVNNAAKLRYRAGTPVPMTLRMPFGGLRRAGPYHSQDTSPWFARSFGLQIVVPSTPHDARALFMSAVKSDDPVLFYEHIALYRDPKIKQVLSDAAPTPIPLGQAAFRRLGSDVSLISYGAYVHKALAAAEQLASEGIACDVLDLRTLAPLDWDRIALTICRTNRVLLVGEDSRTGSILESIASRVQEALFERLDAPVRCLGSLDTPVPYAPSLEDAFLLSTQTIVAAARNLARY